MNCQSEMIQTNAHHPYPQPKDADLHYPSDIRTVHILDLRPTPLIFDLLSKWTSQTVLNCSYIANVLQDDPEEEELRRKKKPVPKYRSCPSPNREKISIHNMYNCKLFHVPPRFDFSLDSGE